MVARSGKSRTIVARWLYRLGNHKHLYETNRTEFRIQFGHHVEARRESDPAAYVRLLIAWASAGQSKLPCLIFDNTDQFPGPTQDAIYQLAHSLESAGPVFNIVPITDRSVWRLSKAGALQSYTARAFYLPVPEAKEIIARRVNFLKAKLDAEPNAANAYFSKRGFSVKMNDLAMLAEAVEKIFVETDYVSGFLGRLGNFDIRRTLRIAERVFLSPDVEIDDIIRAKFGGPSVTADKHKTQRALIKGEYDRFSEAENEFVSNLFYTTPQRPASPLLPFYLLWILRQRLNNVRDDSVEARHWSVSDLCDFFEPCSVPEHHVLQVVRRLYERRQIEALDPNVDEVGIADKVAIKESGMAHLELMLNSAVYLEQMAFVTGVNELFVRDEIRRSNQSRDMMGVRDTFVRYVLKTDTARLVMPQSQHYAQLHEARRQIEQLLSARPRVAGANEHRQ